MALPPEKTPDPIEPLHTHQTMGDEQDGAALDHVECFEEGALGLGIQSGDRFVEDQHGCG